MLGITLAENENSVVITLDKKLISKVKIDRALEDLSEDDLDISHLEAVSDEEQAEIVRGLNATTAEEKEYTLLRHSH
ncbi:MAG: hypothetical protein ABI778_07990 [Ignavibacteriota bacterium]